MSGVGIDLLDVARLEKPLSREHFMRRVFSDYERAYIAGRAATAAGIFCAKEAFVKAAGDGFRIPIGEVAVRHGERGEPFIELSGATAERFCGASIRLSITHTATLAAAVVTIDLPNADVNKIASQMIEDPSSHPDSMINSLEKRLDLEARYPDATLVDDAFVDSLIAPRPRDSHKGDFGRVLIVGGSEGLTGAPQLAAEGALRVGAGLVSMAAPRCVYPLMAGGLREVMRFPVADKDGGYAASAAPELLRRAEGCDAVVLGPGLGRSDGAKTLVFELLTKISAPVVLDADGINAAAANIDVLRGRGAPTVLTPHAVEFSRLGGSVEGGRLDGAKRLAERLLSVVLLKGHETVIASPDGRAFVSAAGNPGMATGGSGDVLAGAIAGLIAQGLPLLDAAAVGAHLHGSAGDLAAAELGEFGMLPSDLLARLPLTLKRIRPRD